MKRVWDILNVKKIISTNAMSQANATLWLLAVETLKHERSISIQWFL